MDYDWLPIDQRPFKGNSFTMDTPTRFPDRKISETILDFANPILETLPPDSALEDINKIMRLHLSPRIRSYSRRPRATTSICES